MTSLERENNVSNVKRMSTNTVALALPHSYYVSALLEDDVHDGRLSDS